LLVLAGASVGRSGTRPLRRSEGAELREELARSERRYRFLVDRLPEGFVVLEEGTIVFANRAFRRILGVSPEAAIGRRLDSFVGPEWLSLYSGRYDVRPSTASLGVHRVELQVERPDGEPRWVEMRFQTDPLAERPAEMVLMADITQRRRAESRLEALNRSFLDLGPDPVANIERLTAACGEILGAACALYNRLEGGLLCSLGAWQAPPGYERVDAPAGHICFDVIQRGPDAGLFLVRNLQDSAYASSDPNVARYGLRTYAGHPVAYGGKVLGSLCVVYTEDVEFDQNDERVLQIVARAVAIEEDRRAAGEGLAEREERYRRLFEASRDGVAIISPTGELLDSNQALAAQLGRPQEEMRGGSAAALLGEAVGAMAATLSAGQGEVAPTLAVELVRRNGTRFPAEIGARRMSVSGRQVVVATVHDLTGQRQAEALHSAVHQISEAVHLTDNLHELLSTIHQVLCGLMGARNFYVALYDPIVDLISFPYFVDEFDPPPAPRRPGRGLTECVLRRGSPMLVSPERFEELRRSGEVESVGTASIDWLGVPLMTRDQAFGVVVVQTYTEGVRYGERERDILTFVSRQIAVAVERKRADDRFRQSQRIEALGRLAGGVAHDFNNLLMAIMGSAELLQKRCTGQADALAELATILRSTSRAADLARGLLAFARRQVLEPADLDLNQVIEQMVPILRRVIPENIEIVFRRKAEQATVRADRGQVDQILMNLAVNCRDAMPSGGRLAIETAQVEIDGEYVASHPWAVAGPYVLLAVTDTGVGMDRETLLHIFDPFFTTKEPGRGTGLGLSTVYGIVKQHGGMIDAESEPGRGSSFKIFLPQVSRTPVDQPRPAPGPIRGGTETILVVEDEAEVRHILVQVLGGLGYRVFEAEDGVAAFARLQEASTEIDLVVSDVVMPRLGGKELWEKANSLPRAPVFLFSSGYGDGLVDSELVRGTRTAFIAKPYGIEELARRVRELLDRDSPRAPA
jgi:PAS domain S-box-containing protein